jgi:hypothetical protein
VLPGAGAIWALKKELDTQNSILYSQLGKIIKDRSVTQIFTGNYAYFYYCYYFNGIGLPGVR